MNLRTDAKTRSAPADAELPIALTPDEAHYAFYAAMAPEEVTEEFLWSRLELHIEHLDKGSRATLRKALEMAYAAHEGQSRKSGEPFITHPVEVTRILAEMGCELEMLISGLLHDTVEDTDAVTLDDIGFHFGPGCQRIVEGETKFSKLSQLDKGTSKEELKAMDLQQLFLAMTEDARIILVKLADRLHNMRTMASMPAHKQAKIAGETLRVFAPLAGLLGLWKIKTELEDLSLQYESPAVYKHILRHRTRTLEKAAPGIADAERMLRAQMAEDTTLAASGLKVSVQPRLRNVYSLYCRAKATLKARMPSVPIDKYADAQMVDMMKRRKALEGITDVIKFYLIVSPAPQQKPAAAARRPSHDRRSAAAPPPAPALSPSHQCYQVLAALHAMWPPVPGSIKDFISTPKQNGYQGLHSSLRTLGCATVGSVEIIVHTHAMHLRAEHGIAAEEWPRAMTPQGAAAPAAARRAASSSNGAAGGLWDPLGFRRMLGRSHDAVDGGSTPGVAVAASNGGSNGSGARAHVNGVAQPYANGSAAPGGAHGAAPRVLLDGAAAPVDVPPAARNGAASSDRAPARRVNGVSAPRANSTPSPMPRGHGTPIGGGPAGDTGAVGLATRLDTVEMSRRVNWLESIRNWQEEFLSTVTACEFMEVMEQDLLGRTVFAFTPSGDIVRLPKGATVVDFAYHVHTEVGNSMRSARVNGVIASPSHELSNAEKTFERDADVVDIIRCKKPWTQKHVEQHRSWLPLARTQSARHKLQKFVREHEASALRSCELEELASTINKRVAEEECAQTWLTVSCHDRPGLLADVAVTVAKHGLNLVSYNGGSHSGGCKGSGYMNLLVNAPRSQLDAVRADLQRIPAVTDTRFGEQSDYGADW